MFSKKSILALGIVAISGPTWADLNTGLVAHYTLDEPVGATVAFDSVGSVNGAVQGGTTFAPGRGVRNGAARFDPATADRIDMGDNFGFTDSSFSIQTWVKLEPGDGGVFTAAPIAKHRAGIAAGYFLTVGDQGDSCGTVGKVNFYVAYPCSGNSTILVNDGGWHQIVGVYDRDNQVSSVYVDGQFQSASSGGNIVHPADAPFSIAGMTDNGGPLVSVYKGWVDEVRVYNRVLDAAEIKTLYVQTPIAPSVYDAALDFSSTDNPNGAWSYGWTSTLGSALNVYPYHGAVDILNIWYEPALSTNPEPNISYNSRGNPEYKSGCCIWKPGQLTFHPGSNGEYSVVRWTSPKAGVWSIAATFSGIDFTGGTTTDVHVLHNKASVFNAEVNGYGSLASLPPTPLYIKAGDVVDFTVGFGSNGTFYSDTTSLAATISSVSEGFAFKIINPIVTLNLGPGANDDRVIATGYILLQAMSDGITPVTEEVTIQIGHYSVVVPAHSFKRSRAGVFSFAGMIEGIKLDIRFTPKSVGYYAFSVSAIGAKLEGTNIPIAIKITIGNDNGSVVLNTSKIIAKP